MWEGTGVLGASWVVVNDAAPRLIVLFDPNRDIEERPQGHAIRIAYSRCTVESEPVCVPEGELEAPGSGTFVMGDIDDDGVEDIVSADGERIFIHRGEQPDHDQVSWGPREPLGEAAVHSLRNVWPWVNALSVADLDDDGLTDVIAIDGSRIAIFFGNQAAGSEDAQFLMTAENSLLLRFHIASTSERLDLIAETESGIVVFRNTGNRTFESMAVDTDVPSDTDSVSPIIKGTFTGMGRVELFVYPRGADAHVIAFDRDYTWNVVDVALPFTGGGVDEYGDVTALDIDADGMDEIVRSWVAFQDGCS